MPPNCKVHQITQSVKHRLPGPTPIIYGSVSLGGRLRICISSEPHI